MCICIIHICHSRGGTAGPGGGGSRTDGEERSRFLLHGFQQLEITVRAALAQPPLSAVLVFHVLAVATPACTPACTSACTPACTPSLTRTRTPSPASPRPRRPLLKVDAGAGGDQSWGFSQQEEVVHRLWEQAFLAALGAIRRVGRAVLAEGRLLYIMYTCVYTYMQACSCTQTR